MLKFKNILKVKLAEEDKTLTSIAVKLGTQPQNLSNKLNRGSITYDDAQTIADILGYDIVWVKRS
jgi:plasmid maintenance system antidote protein VapI